MRISLILTAGLFLAGGVFLHATGDKPDLTGTWKLDAAHSEAGQSEKDLVILIKEQDESIHMKETRGSNEKHDVSEFTCELGKQCAMKDGGDKAQVWVYFNGPALVVVKTNGRREDSTSKRRFSLSPAGDALVEEVNHISPQGKEEKLVFSKAQ